MVDYLPIPDAARGSLTRVPAALQPPVSQGPQRTEGGSARASSAPPRPESVSTSPGPPDDVPQTSASQLSVPSSASRRVRSPTRDHTAAAGVEPTKKVSRPLSGPARRRGGGVGGKKGGSRPSPNQKKQVGPAKGLMLHYLKQKVANTPPHWTRTTTRSWRKK